MLVLRCERTEKSTKEPGPRLLVVDQKAITVYFEDPDAFGHKPWSDLPIHDEALDKPDGLKHLREDTTIELEQLDNLDMKMMSEPQVRRATSPLPPQPPRMHPPPASQMWDDLACEWMRSELTPSTFDSCAACLRLSGHLKADRWV